MRTGWVVHAPTFAAFAAFLLMAGGLAIALDPYGQPVHRIPVRTIEPVDLPPPESDQDGDSYADDADLWDGDAMARLHVAAGIGPGQYLLLGSDDDHWRFGLGRELEWFHIVDPDPLGLDPGSRAWSEHSIRTGAWTRLDDGPGAMLLNVRDDAASVALHLELWQQRRGADRLQGSWELRLERTGIWTDGQSQHPGSQVRPLPGSDLAVSLSWRMAPAPDDALDIARAWAPGLHFAAGEPFPPTQGDVLEAFHGFARRDRDLKTWSAGFNNERDGHRLLVADFDGDRDTDHEDVRLLTDILREGGRAPPTVYGHVTLGAYDRIVVQYWFLSIYNFVRGEDGRDVAALGHAGDREFIQLEFTDIAAALAGPAGGPPLRVAYSQHYGGIAIDDPVAAPPPVYVALGSHASYPVPGDDAALRPGFIGFGDTFYGDGDVWSPDDYTLELLAGQSWHMGYRWGPATRFHRDVGDTGRPLLRHGFQYPFQDPVAWADDLTVVAYAELFDRYRTPTEQRWA